METFQKLFSSFITPFPARDWAIALILLIALFVGLVSYAAYLFMGIRAGTIVGEAPTISGVLPNVSRADLMNTLEVYRIKRTKFESGEF
ncbi:hypothetical protein K2P56_04245 [Patescibacteria group bacterium]|nr:hypothetical protein [Patescibacteria group bacterium]